MTPPRASAEAPQMGLPIPEEISHLRGFYGGCEPEKTAIGRGAGAASLAAVRGHLGDLKILLLDIGLCPETLRPGQ
jgi:hypothetical protein